VLQYWKSTRSSLADRRAERLYSSSLDDLFAELLHAIRAFVQKSGAEIKNQFVNTQLLKGCAILQRCIQPPLLALRGSASIIDRCL
jgi:hypothetical protein